MIMPSCCYIADNCSSGGLYNKTKQKRTHLVNISYAAIAFGAGWWVAEVKEVRHYPNM